jgi:hypothetical protein
MDPILVQGHWENVGIRFDSLRECGLLEIFIR